MKRIEERRKQRRVYLRQKGQAYIAALFFALLVLGLFQPFLWRPLFGHQVLHPLLQPLPNFLKMTVDIVSVLLLAAGVTGFTVNCIRALNKGASLPYVPPVTREETRLPAEEVLLRASKEERASERELLRVAASHSQTPDDQLLRAVSGSAQER